MGIFEKHDFKVVLTHTFLDNVKTFILIQKIRSGWALTPLSLRESLIGDYRNASRRIILDCRELFVIGKQYEQTYRQISVAGLEQ